MGKILILRGNRGNWEDETGKRRDYDRGALHDQTAKEYARRKGYVGEVLDISGDPPKPQAGKKLNRSASPQTRLAITTFRSDKEVVGFYGFSGGGYNIYWILQELTEAELKRLELLVVLGAEDAPASKFEAKNYKGGKWDLVYKTNPPQTSKVVPKGARTHMFGPEWLLEETPDPAARKP